MKPTHHSVRPTRREILDATIEKTYQKLRKQEHDLIARSKIVRKKMVKISKKLEELTCIVGQQKLGLKFLDLQKITKALGLQLITGCIPSVRSTKYIRIEGRAEIVIKQTPQIKTLIKERERLFMELGDLQGNAQSQYQKAMKFHKGFTDKSALTREFIQHILDNLPEEATHHLDVLTDIVAKAIPN